VTQKLFTHFHKKFVAEQRNEEKKITVCQRNEKNRGIGTSEPN